MKPKQRRVRSDVTDSVELKIRPRPRVPIHFRHHRRRRSNSQQGDHHQLAVRVPARFDEAMFGRPAHRQILIAVEQPVPIHPAIQLISQTCDFVVVEIRLARQNAADK